MVALFLGLVVPLALPTLGSVYKAPSHSYDHRSSLKLNPSEIKFSLKNSGTLGIEPGPAGRGARTLPLCYADPPCDNLLGLNSEAKFDVRLETKSYFYSCACYEAV